MARDWRAAGLPLVDVVMSGSGRAWSGGRYAESVVGGRLRYVGHEERVNDLWRELRINLADVSTGLRADVVYRALKDGASSSLGSASQTMVPLR